MLPLLSIASAATLDFVQLELAGDDEGVHLTYLLAADDWVQIAQARSQGRSTAVTVTLQAADFDYSAVVPLNAASRTVRISRRAWPLGTWGFLQLREIGDFDAVAIAGRQGEQLRLQVHGGVDGARPINPPLSTDPLGAPPPLPVTALPAPEPDDGEPVDEVVTDEASEEPVPDEPVTDGAADGGHEDFSTGQAIAEGCRSAFTEPDDQALCGGYLLGRPGALDELAACTSINRPRHQRACLETLSQVGRPSADLVDACIEGIGPNSDALGCVRAGALHAADPVPVVEACTAFIFDPGDVVACVKRAARIPYPVGPLLEACSIGFPGDVFDCLARAGRTTYDRAPLVSACTTAFTDDDRTRCVSTLAPAKGEDAAGVVRACVQLYEQRDLRFECMERARGVPSEARILHCGEQRRRDDQLACIGG